MNDERYILARLVRELIRIEEESRTKQDYRSSFHSEDICLIIEKIRADAVLGEEVVDEDLPFNNMEVE